MLFGSNLVAVYTPVPAYLQSLSRSTVEFLNNVHLSMTYTVIRRHCNVYTLASKLCSYEMIHPSLPQFFCSMGVFLCYNPCLVSLLLQARLYLWLIFTKKLPLVSLVSSVLLSFVNANFVSGNHSSHHLTAYGNYRCISNELKNLWWADGCLIRFSFDCCTEPCSTITTSSIATVSTTSKSVSMD